VVSVGGGIGPVADAGPDRSVVLGGQTRLTGVQSTDVDGDGLSYSWSLIGAPAGSSADLDAEAGFETMFTADVAGDYVVQLSVSDGVSSATDTVLLSTGTVRSVVSAGDDMRLIADRATLVGAGDGTVVWSVPGLSAGTELAELATPTAQTSEVFFPGQSGGGTVSGDDAQAAIDLLGIYSVVTEGNVDAAVDIEGRSLIGGSLVGNSATFGSRLNGQQGTDFITVAGNITGGPKNINNGGNVRFGGTVSTNLNLNGGGSRINDPTVSAAEEISLLRDLSVDLSNAPANSVAQIPSPSGQNGPVRFIASPDESGVAVFDIEDGDLLLSNDRVQQIEMQLNGADAVIINVGGSNIRFDRGNIVGSFSNDSVSRKVIWNFHEATNVFFERAVEGTVLAPNAFVENRTNIDGSVIATSLRARGPIRLQTFNGEGLVGGASESVSFALAQLTTTASSEDEPAFDTAVLTTGNLRPIANAGTGSIVAGGEAILLSKAQLLS